MRKEDSRTRRVVCSPLCVFQFTHRPSEKFPLVQLLYLVFLLYQYHARSSILSHGSPRPYSERVHLAIDHRELLHGRWPDGRHRHTADRFRGPFATGSVWIRPDLSGSILKVAG